MRGHIDEQGRAHLPCESCRHRDEGGKTCELCIDALDKCLKKPAVECNYFYYQKEE